MKCCMLSRQLHAFITEFGFKLHTPLADGLVIAFVARYASMFRTFPSSVTPSSFIAIRAVKDPEEPAYMLADTTVVDCKNTLLLKQSA